MKRINPASLIWLLCHAIALSIGLALALTGRAILTQVGTSAIAAGITGWVIFAYIFLTEGTRERLKLLVEFGVVNAFEARAARIKPEYDSRVLHASDAIDVLGFGLRALREDYLSDFSQWKQHARVRILLLDPEFPTSSLSYAHQRDGEEGNSPRTIETDVRKFIADSQHLIAPGSFEIRLYRCLPSVNVFRVDDELFWGPYLIQEQSRNAPTFIVRRGGILFRRMIDHFNHIWSSEIFSRAVPEDWILKRQP